MTNYDKNLDDLGRAIQDIVDRAVNSRDYQKLNQTIRQAVDKGTDTIRKTVDAVSRQENPAPQKKKDLSLLYGSTGSLTTRGVLQTVGGGILTLISLSLVLGLTGFQMLVAGAGMLTLPLAFSAVSLGGGLGLIFSGTGTLKMVNRFKVYRRILGTKTQCALEKLAGGVGKNVNFVRKELLRMIGQGLFREGHLDAEQRYLITSDETWQLFEQSRLQLEQRKRQEALEQARQEASPRDAQVQEVLDRGNAFIREIRRCNDAIPGEEISAKIDRMEQLVRRIFARAETHPQVIPDLKKMMDYYLPMTVKLLNAYADMDAQSVQGETIMNSKKEIEATLDTLNRAFEKLLDDLFADTALDISSDISVLNTLLAQEGLTEDELTKTRNSIT